MTVRELQRIDMGLLPEIDQVRCRKCGTIYRWNRDSCVYTGAYNASVDTHGLDREFGLDLWLCACDGEPLLIGLDSSDEDAFAYNFFTMNEETRHA